MVALFAWKQSSFPWQKSYFAWGSLMKLRERCQCISSMIWFSAYNGKVRSKLAVSIGDFIPGKTNDLYKPFVCVEAERTKPLRGTCSWGVTTRNTHTNSKVTVQKTHQHYYNRIITLSCGREQRERTTQVFKILQIALA